MPAPIMETFAPYPAGRDWGGTAAGLTDGGGSAKKIKLFYMPGYCKAPGAWMKYSLY